MSDRTTSIVNKDKNAVDIAATGAEFILDKALVSSGLATEVILGEVAKEIPVFGTIVKLAELGTKIRDQQFEQKLRRFSKPLTAVDQQARAEFARRVEGDPALQRRITDNVPLLIEHTNELEKAEILGWLFRALMEERTTYEIFYRIANCVLRTTAHDLSLLYGAVTNGGILKPADTEALIASGFMQSIGVAVSEVVAISHSPNETAKQFVELISPYMTPPQS